MACAKNLIVMAMVLGMTWGCSDRSEPPVPTPDASADAAADAPVGEVDAEPGEDASLTDSAVADATPDGSLSDGSTPDAMPMGACEGGDTYLYVLNLLDVARVAGTVSRGFNLDGRISDGSDALSCNKTDFRSPRGVEGIDNQLQALIPTLERLSEVNISTSIRESIASGTLLVLLQLEHVDSLVSDECVTMSVLTGKLPAGVTAPRLDAAGRLEAGQTFDVSRASYGADMEPMIYVEGASIASGVLTASGFDLSLPIPAGSAGTISLVSRSSQVEARVSAGALQAGSLGGAVRTSELGPALGSLMLDVPVSTILLLVGLETDLEKSGRTCGALSAALELGGVSAVMGAITAP